MNDIDLLFTAAGGKFGVPVRELQAKLQRCKAIIFDWDGVFNDGTKADSSGSPFSEPDSMGVNLFRLGYYLQRKQMCAVGILTGEENKAALHLARREHYHSVYFKSVDKIKSFNHFVKQHAIDPKEVIFVFDDVLDLATAEQCGVRIQIGRSAGVLFNQHVSLHGLVDYTTGNPGSRFAVREACELLMGLFGSFDSALTERKRFAGPYTDYLKQRDAIDTKSFALMAGEIVPY